MPQLLPVMNDSAATTTKVIAGNRSAFMYGSTALITKSGSPMPFIESCTVSAPIVMNIIGTIDAKPDANPSQNPSNESAFVGRYIISITIIAAARPMSMSPVTSETAITTARGMTKNHMFPPFPS